MRFRNWLTREWPTIAIITVGILLQVFLITRPIETVTATTLSDDAFFYFKVAHNISQGFGSTFDGVNPANGYHPLWMLVLVPIFQWFGSSVPDVPPLYALLYLSVAMNLVTAFVVARILTRFAESRWIRAFALIIWVLNPFLLYQQLNGLETSLALFFFSFVFLLALRIEERKQNNLDARARDYWLIGALSAFMIMARLDMAFYLVAFLAWIFFREGLSGWKNALRTAAIPAVFTGIYELWNYVNFKMILPASAKAEMLFSHVLTYQDNGETFAQFIKAIIYFTHYVAIAVMRDTGAYALAAATFGMFIALCIRGDIKIPRSLSEIRVTAALFVGFLMLFIGNASVRWAARDWYFVSFDLFFAIAVCIVLAKLFPYITYKRAVSVVLLGAIVLAFYANWSKYLRWPKNPGWNHGDLILAADWMSANLPEGSRVGSFTPGVMGYFSKAPVVALDGLINNSSYVAMRERKLWQFMKDDTTHFVETGNHITYSFKSFFGTDEDLFAKMTKLPNDPGLPNMTFYKLKP